MTTAPASSGSSKKLIIGLAIGGGVLLLAVIALLFLLLGRGLAAPGAIDTPSPSDTSASPSPSASETPVDEPVDNGDDDPPPPADNSVSFASFSAPTTTICDAGDEDNQPPKPRIQVSWAGANAVDAYYMPSSSEDTATGYQIPTSGNQEQILIGDEPSLFPCFHETDQDYTIVLVGSDGSRVAKHWNVRNVGDQ